MIPRQYHQNGGFSLIEVMVAILILGIALTGLIHGLNTALGSNKESELQTVAALYAEGKIEELRVQTSLDNGEESGDCGAQLPLYRWKQTVGDTDVPGLHEVSVEVAQAQTGRSIYELKTLVFAVDDAADPAAKKASGSKKSRKNRAS